MARSFYPQTTLLFRLANLFPGDQALRARDMVLARPQKGPSAAIKRIQCALGKKERRHGIDQLAVYHTVDQHSPAHRVQQGALPPGQVSVGLADQRGKGTEAKLVTGQW